MFRIIITATSTCALCMAALAGGSRDNTATASSGRLLLTEAQRMAELVQLPRGGSGKPFGLVANHEPALLHFSHPLVSESPSPDTKVRLDYRHLDLGGEEQGTVQSVGLEAEYAFSPWLSIEIRLPYTFLDPDGELSVDHFGNAEIGIKYANFTFAARGVLVGGGLELGLPTGDETLGIGSGKVWEIEPFLNFGYQRGPLQVVVFAAFGFPVDGEEEADWEFAWNTSFLYRVADRVELLLELDGENVSGGDEDGHGAVHLTPGIKIRPGDEHLQVGIGVGFPLTSDREFDLRIIVSVFYHF